MDASEFLVLSLGMQPSDIKIEDFKVNSEDLTATITVRQRREACVCPECDEPLYGVKQWRLKKLFGSPIGSFQKIKIRFFQLQGACGKCLQHKLARADCIHPSQRKMTTAFAEHCGRWMEETTCAAVERMTGCSSMSLWRLDQWRTKKMKEDFELPSDLPVELMSADEVHMMTVRPKATRHERKTWDKKFVTNLVCYGLSRVVANAKGRSTRSLSSCLKQVPEDLRKRIRFIAVDMHDGFITAAEKYCPNALVAVDRFHVAEALNKAFDKVRRAEFDAAKEAQDKFQKEMLMPSNRFILVERSKEIGERDRNRLAKLRKLNENINTAMLLIEYFHKILDKKTVDSFRKGLVLWQELVEQSKLKPFQDFLNTVRKYQDRIETYIKSHLTTAVSEGLNNKIKVLKRVGYTYTNETSFQNKILQRCGFINSRNINTNHWFWHVT